MVERNAPCPCGSGKKYKKCCALKENGAQTDLVEDELARVIFSYPEQLFKDREHLHTMEKLTQQWNDQLGEYVSDDQIDALVFDYYLFIKAREHWTRHVLRAMNGVIRSVTQSTLKQWSHPIALVGKVIGEQDNYFEIDEVLGHETYKIEKDEIQNIAIGDIIIAIAFRDARKVEQGLYFFNDVLGIRDKDGQVMQDIEQLAESSKASNLSTFFEEYMLDVYEVVLNQEERSVQEFMDEELTEEEQAVCDLLTEQFERFEVPPMQTEIGQMITVGYLRLEEPTFRKPEIIAAAIFKAMEDYGLIQFTYDFTQKEVAKLFNVSVASMAKHIGPVQSILDDMIEEMAEQHGEQILGGGSTAAYYVGTDPLLTERANWEMACRVETFESDSIDDLQAFMNQKANERFIPKGKAQKAQAYAYDAYEQEDEDARIRLASAAYFTDPENVDALLLRAEQAKTTAEAKQKYTKAIAIGERLFDGDFPDSPWELVGNRPFMRALFAYGVYLFEREQFKEALGYFQQLLALNPNDNQGARHLAIAAAIHDGQYSVANHLFGKFKEQPFDQAVYRYLQWLLELKQGIESDTLVEALELNGFVIELVSSDLPQISYPRENGIVPGFMDEAFYIAFLLGAGGELEL